MLAPARKVVYYRFTLYKSTTRGRHYVHGHDFAAIPRHFECTRKGEVIDRACAIRKREREADQNDESFRRQAEAEILTVDYLFDFDIKPSGIDCERVELAFRRLALREAGVSAERATL